MSEKEKNKSLPSFKLLTYIYGVFIISICGTLFFYNKVISLIFLFLFIIIGILYGRRNRSINEFINTYFLDLSRKVGTVSEYTVNEIPMGVIFYGDNYKIKWANKYIVQKFSAENKKLNFVEDISDKLLLSLDAKSEVVPIFKYSDRIYKAVHYKNRKLLYITDITEHVALEKSYAAEKIVICMFYLDNLDDVVQGLDDQSTIQLQNLCASEILRWSKEANFLVRRIDSDRFLGILNEEILAELEKSKFDILDSIRELTTKEGTPITLSIGIGTGDGSIIELGKLAQTNLDLALGRGGDQVVIKNSFGTLRFYGGQTNPLGKRTRVRARVISNAISDLIVDSDHIIIMGHRIPDMDVYGSALGLLQMVKANNRSGYIVREGLNEAQEIRELFAKASKIENLLESFISVDEAAEIMTDKTLLIVVDTHKSFLTIGPRLVSEAKKIVIIDHHRRSEDIISNSLLTYIEPYASSTSELVTELMSYHSGLKKIDKFTATSLLAGIIVDTKSFTVKTGVRTFDAASYLRMQGSDLEEIQSLFKEEISYYLERNKLIENYYFYEPGFVITYSFGERYYDQIQIAKAADTLLTLEAINASFVVALNSKKEISISARSRGEVNVQLIMEELGGGGHMNTAAVQLNGCTIEEAISMLQNAIDKYIEGRSKV